MQGIGVIGGGTMGAGSADLVGLDVHLDVARHLTTSLGPRFEPPALLADNVARGVTGKKARQGFYDWSGR